MQTKGVKQTVSATKEGSLGNPPVVATDSQPVNEGSFAQPTEAQKAQMRIHVPAVEGARREHARADSKLTAGRDVPGVGRYHPASRKEGRCLMHPGHNTQSGPVTVRKNMRRITRTYKPGVERPTRWLAEDLQDTQLTGIKRQCRDPKGPHRPMS